MMAGERVDSDKDDDTTKTRTARTMLTSLFDTTTNLRSIPGREGGISMMMRTVTMTMKTMNEDNDEDTNCKDNDDLIFFTQQATCALIHSWQEGGCF